jgi:predicted DNA-binding protein YlxM (UPF0122 family)
MANENTTFAEEFGTAGEVSEETVNTTLPEGTEAAPVERQTYTLKDGSQGSRAAFIRELFLEDNLSRKQIAEEYGFPYRVVYSATVNMTNAAEAPQRGRSATATVIQLTADGQVVLHKDGKVLVDGEAFEGDVSELGELYDKSRNEWIQEQMAAGVSRGDIAKKLDMSYGVIYGLTKSAEGSRQRIELELEDGTKVSRSEYIRMQFAAGKSRGEIAKELDVPYSVVWQATKTEKAASEKYAELVEELKGFADKISDPDLFGQVIDALGTLTIKEEKKPAVEADEPASDTPAEFAE